MLWAGHLHECVSSLLSYLVAEPPKTICQFRSNPLRKEELPPPRFKPPGSTGREALKLSEQAWSSLMESLAEHGQLRPSIHGQRRADRTKVDEFTGISFDVVQPAGTTTRVPGCAQDISASGIRVIHKSYFHPGLSCTCWVPSTKGELSPLPGVVSWCQHIDGVIHCSGIAFRSPIQVEELAIQSIQVDG